MIVTNKSKKQELIFKDRGQNACLQNLGPHGPLVTDSVRGEILCASCGAVLIDKMEDSGPEQRSLAMEDYNLKSRSGLGTTLSLHDKGLATIIDRNNKDASGNYLSSDMKMMFHRLRTWDSRSKSSTEERSLKSAFGILQMLQSKLELSDALAERAAYIYRKAISERMTAGRSIAGIITASVYASCREFGVPRTLQDAANAGNLTVKELSRDYRILVKKLRLRLESYDSSEFVTRISTSVGISEKTKRLALELLHKAKERGITDGKNPVSLAAAALFLSVLISHEGKTQGNIAKASGISSVTIRNVAKTMKKYLELNHQ